MLMRHPTLHDRSLFVNFSVGYPRDPFHRVDIVHSRRHVRVEHDGELIAETPEPYLLFEPPLAVRYYAAPRDVRTDLLGPSATRSVCAYRAMRRTGPSTRRARTSHAPIGSGCARQPRCDRMAFFNEHVDVLADGTRAATSGNTVVAPTAGESSGT